MKKLVRFLPLMALFVAEMGSPARADAPPGPFFNGFEHNTNGWFDSTNGGDGTITRRPSGYSNSGGYADGITSAAGNWHARLIGSPCFTPPNQDCTGPFTRWGGYTATFPAGGYLTQVDIYLDVSWAASHPDTRFDWSSAINDNTGSFRRDFVFNVSTQQLGDPGPSPHFIVQTSTNAFRSGANPHFPCPNPVAPPNSCRPPIEITASGWYTFRHTFHDDGSGFLAIDFDIFPLGSNVAVMHQTIDSNPYDPMSMVGGNRYGWLANEEIPDLPIDNSLRTGLCHNGDGDGDVEGNDSHKGHMHFHKNSCDGSNDDVEEDDDNSGEHFKSTSTDSATFTPDENSQTVTMIGTGLHNGLPVGFTMIAVDNQGLAPAVFTLILTDGYSITGSVTSGTVLVQ
jgi:hypothetical protein